MTSEPNICNARLFPSQSKSVIDNRQLDLFQGQGRVEMEEDESIGESAFTSATVEWSYKFCLCMCACVNLPPAEVMALLQTSICGAPKRIMVYY